MPEIYDVVIVGAGISGLAAARHIHRTGSGLSYVILEARDRVGGKTLTHRSRRQDQTIQQDLGAAWINDTNQSRIWELSQELGLHCYEQNIRGEVVVEDFDGGLVTFPYGGVPRYKTDEDSEACVQIRDEVEAISTAAGATAAEIFDSSASSSSFASPGSTTKRKWLDDMSFETWLHLQGANEKARATARVWTHAMLGVDPSEVSALYYLEYCRAGGGLMTMRSDAKDGGQYLRIKEGTSAFAQGLHKMLKPDSVKFGRAVVAINDSAAQDGSPVVVVTTKRPDSQQFHCRKVIVSIPTPIYKTITFSPPLPAAKTAVVNGTRYGFYCKYILAFTKPFWRDRNFCGLAQSFIGPVSVFRDTSVDDEATYCLTSFIGGVWGRKWAAQTREDKERSVLEQISNVFAGGEDASTWFIEAFESPWMDEEWSGWGCPCPVMPPGVLADGWEALSAPHGNVHFVGTELATVWRGYMEGAYRTGEKGATQVMASLKEVHKSH